MQFIILEVHTGTFVVQIVLSMLYAHLRVHFGKDGLNRE